MKPQSFEYVAAREVEQVIAALAEHGEDAKVLAGGQSLVPLMALRLASPAVLVDINRVAGLDAVQSGAGWLSLGATVRHRALERPWGSAGEVPGPLGQLLAAAGRRIGHPPIRNRGTFAGSLAHGDPRAEWPLVAVTLGAEVELRSAAGRRQVAAEEFLGSPFAPDCRPGEVVVGVRLPLLGPEAGVGFSELSRTGGAFLTGAACAVLWRDAVGTVTAARVAAAGPFRRAARLAPVEQALLGQQIDQPGLAATAAGELAALVGRDDRYGAGELSVPVARRLLTALCADAVGQGLAAVA